MSELVVVDSDAFKRMEDVAELHLQSKTPYQIARELGIKVVEAKAAIAQWQEIVNNDMASRDAARDHLNAMVKRYESLIAEANANLKNLKSLGFDEKVSAQINTTIKVIGELDAKRVDLLQKAGLLENNELGDQLAERERNEQILVDILRNNLCAKCAPTVMRRLQEVTGQVEDLSGGVAHDHE